MEVPAYPVPCVFHLSIALLLWTDADELVPPEDDEE